MLTIKNNFVIIETANTTYAMMITPHGEDNNTKLFQAGESRTVLERR